MEEKMEEKQCDGGFQSTSLMKAARFDQPELVAIITHLKGIKRDEESVQSIAQQERGLTEFGV